MTDKIKQNLGPHDVCVDLRTFRGQACDPVTGRILDYYKCRDPRNSARTNPKQRSGLNQDANEKFWGID